MALSFQGKAQIFPVQSSTQLVPPYSVYLSDHATPGNEKLRVILVQRDLTQPSYQLRLVMQVEWNGKVIMRTSRSYNPAPTSLDPGVPTIISGAELFPYLDSRNIDFVGYSREQYERTKALPEGSYRISFTAYDYRRQDVQVSNEGSSFYYLSKNEPPLINLPVCGAKVPVRHPQQVIFSWLPRNTSSPASAGGTQYEFSLYEIRPEGRNPNDVVLTSQPVFKTTIDYTQMVYGPAEPQLVENMRYAWRVRAIDTQGRDAFRNNGYSEVCTFTYGGVDPAFIVGGIEGLQAEGESERSARIWWEQGNFDSYRIHYKKSGQGHEWFTSDLLAKDLDPAKEEGELKLFDLEPDTEYETRAQAKKMGTPGPYTDIVRFRTLPVRVAHCGDPALLPEGDPGEPFREAIKGMAIDVDGMEMTLLDVVHLGDGPDGQGWYKGLGRVSVDYLGGAAFTVSFDRVFINTDRQVVLGRIDFVTNGVAVMAGERLAAQKKEREEKNTDNLAENRNENQAKDIIFEGVIDSVLVNEVNEIIIIGTEGERVAYERPVDPATGEVLPTSIVDRKGNEYVADKDGNVTKGGSGGGAGAGSITADTSYPLRKFVVVGYYSQGYKPEWFYCRNEPLSTSLKSELEQKLFNSYGTYANTTLGELGFDTDCSIKFDPDFTIAAKLLYKSAENGDLKFITWDNDFDLKWVLNGNDIPSLNGLEGLLNTGSNTLELKTKRKSESTFKSTSTLTINYGTTDLSQFRVRVYREGEAKLYEATKTIGDVREGERILEVGENIQLELLQSDGQGGWEIVEQPVWDIQETLQTTTKFELTLEEMMGGVTVTKENLLGEAFYINLRVERKEEKVNLPENNFAKINVDALTDLSDSKKEKRKEKYAKALEEIKEKSAGLYNRFSNSIPSLQVYIVPGSSEKIPSVGAGQRLNGFANAKVFPIPGGNYALLDIEYTETDLDGKIIKNTAKLVTKLNNGQKEQIRIASEKQEMTDLFEEIYERIKEYNTELAEMLKEKTMAGKYDESYIDGIRYEVKPEEATEYITVGSEQMEIYLNDDAVGTTQSLMTRTLAHELKHLEYAFLHPYTKLKWLIIEDKDPGNTDYELGDILGSNGHCSAGAGHEMYNPENKEVCDEEAKY